MERRRVVGAKGKIPMYLSDLGGGRRLLGGVPSKGGKERGGEWVSSNIKGL